MAKKKATAKGRLAQELLTRLQRPTDTVETCWSEKEISDLWRSLQSSKQARRRVT